MVYKDMKELNDNYENEREDMNYEESLKYVNDCFDTLESVGFLDTYNSPYDDYRQYNGQKFTVVDRVSDEVDLECLPLWHIRFEDGTVITAFPEEICKSQECI